MAIALTHLGGTSLGIFGLARSGLASVGAAIAGGAKTVWAWDDREAARDAASTLGATIAPIANWPWGSLPTLVLAPGVPFTHPEPHEVVALARTAGTEIICDIELLYREHGKGCATAATFIAITGTNGKSTTTALVGHILNACGRNVQVGGNIGRAALDLDPPVGDAGPGEGTVYVLELSSYQLDLVDQFCADIAVWLNLSADHLDRHGDMDGYRAAKERIFLNQGAGAARIIGVDEPALARVAAELQYEAPELLRVAMQAGGEADFTVNDDGDLAESISVGAPVKLAANTALRGRHNLQNAAFALLTCRSLGLAEEAILTAMKTFTGLEHRMEPVGKRGRVMFINDSKATNADAAARALAAFDPIYWIAGGQAKADGIDGLGEYFPRITKAYLIGEAATRFSASLAGKADHTIAGDLLTATTLAGADAALDPAAEPVVLLSPAAASFDQFDDFEARGRAFTDVVRTLCQTEGQSGTHEGKQEMIS